MNLVGVLNDYELGILEEADTELFTGRAAVGEQSRAKLRVYPGSHDELGAKRGVAGVHDFEHATDFTRTNQLLLDK